MLLWVVLLCKKSLAVGSGGYILCVHVAILVTGRLDIIDTLCAQKLVKSGFSFITLD
jgi:hypothetical protein